ncbi:uncharacterized protein PpBr36_09947 [Pyricularia pennisetigena]|uniref:uncharacterized protein n=1 Tax=Pyricularia pennisetigena TaxID=1578925 RepID=UPI0011523484|nr:uncharacterized protein PpBr36_09947 [Pyricularia pennisetigena]TLS22531.1 hypothetical protein PpBr36_09947 [Pyricularia pennisetigena]
MQIFKIVQILGLLAVGTSALPTPANVADVQPAEGAHLEARSQWRGYNPGRFSSQSVNGGIGPDSSYPETTYDSSRRCGFCGARRESARRVEEHQAHKHKEELEANGGRYSILD